jgi:AcrR family transcriptional regulator
MVALEEKILSIAMEEFSVKGYEGATTKEIAKKAGVNEVTLFRKFGSKEKLVKYAVKQGKKLALENLDRTLMGIDNSDVREFLLALYSRLLDFLVSKFDFILLTIWEGRKRSEIGSEAITIPTSIVQKIATALEKYQVKGEIKKVDTNQVATIFIGHLLHQAMIRRYVKDQRYRNLLTVSPAMFVDVLLQGIYLHGW